MQLLANILIDGLAYGMVLFVIAVGLSVTLGLMRFVNLSHGAFAMIGGYCAALLTREAQWSFWLARAGRGRWPPALLGAVLEALVLRQLYRRSELEQVLFTIGLTFFLIASDQRAGRPAGAADPAAAAARRLGGPRLPHAAGAAPAGDRRRPARWPLARHGP